MRMSIEHLFNILQISIRSISQQRLTIELSYILKRNEKIIWVQKDSSVKSGYSNSRRKNYVHKSVFHSVRADIAW